MVEKYQSFLKKKDIFFPKGDMNVRINIHKSIESRSLSHTRILHARSTSYGFVVDKIETGKTKNHIFIPFFVL
jgi:hypothetical protein